jgi:hypothetical protein
VNESEAPHLVMQREPREGDALRLCHGSTVTRHGNFHAQAALAIYAGMAAPGAR